MMKLISFASGSKGNCALLSVNEKNYLIDIGITYKNLMERMKENKMYINKFDGIFITHEHSDHILGLSTFLKNTNCFIYLTKGTYENLKIDVEKFAAFGRFKIIEPLTKYYDGTLTVVPIELSHDAKQPVGYVFKSFDKKISFISDTGYINEKYRSILKNADVYFIEANHSVDILMNSNRHWRLKQRIVGDNGHLSNQQTLEFLTKNVGENTKNIILTHLSEECNEANVLRETFNNFTSEYENIEITIALQNEVSKVIAI